jgi:hypothetical protein
MTRIGANFRKILHTAIPVAAGLALTLHANASVAAVTTEQRVACTPDVFRLCSSEIPNVDNIIACMVAKKASLSHACRSVFDAALQSKTASRE